MGSEAEAFDEPNPFRSGAIRPGAVDYRFPDGEDADTLVARLAAAGWSGRIQGPHGTGKSTLLRSLAAAVERAGRRFELTVLVAGDRRWRPSAEQLARWDARTLVVVDGFEQLGCWARRRLAAACRRRGAGLLATTHDDVGPPLLVRTAPDVGLACELAAALQAGSRRLVTDDDVRARFAARRGDLRETLFDLYDLYELRRRTGGR